MAVVFNKTFNNRFQFLLLEFCLFKLITITLRVVCRNQTKLNNARRTFQKPKLWPARRQRGSVSTKPQFADPRNKPVTKPVPIFTSSKSGHAPPNHWTNISPSRRHVQRVASHKKSEFLAQRYRKWPFYCPVKPHRYSVRRSEKETARRHPPAALANPTTTTTTVPPNIPRPTSAVS